MRGWRNQAVAARAGYVDVELVGGALTAERIEHEYDVVVETLIAIENQAMRNGARAAGIGAVDAHVQMRARDKKASRRREVRGRAGFGDRWTSTATGADCHAESSCGASASSNIGYGIAVISAAAHVECKIAANSQEAPRSMKIARSRERLSARRAGTR